MSRRPIASAIIMAVTMAPPSNGGKRTAPWQEGQRLPSETGVQRVVHALADEIDGKHGEEDGHARNGAEPPGHPEHAAPGPHLKTPAHHVGIGEPEEGEARLD